MIKKYILGLFIFGFSFFGFSFAVNYQIGLDKYVSTVDNQFELGVLKGGSVLTSLLGSTKSVFAVNESILFWWANDGMPYFYGGGTQHLGQGFFKNYYVCDVMTGSASPSFFNCSKQSISTDILKGFFNKVAAGDYFSYDYGYGTDNYGRRGEFYHICFSSNEIGQSLCFSPGDDCNYNINQCTVNLENSQNLSNVTFGNISRNWLGTGPGILNNSFDGGTGSFNYSGNLQLISDDVNSVINFFESRYGFNENICYVGTDDLDTEYGSGNISFDLGTGGTIFSLYRKFYSGSDLKDIGTFINVRQLNYNQWFNVRSADENSFFLASWDGPGTNVKVFYDNLGFPFMGKSAALFFMSNYIFNSSPEYQMGDEIATYCFAKLNKDNLSNGSVDFTEYWSAVPDYVKGIVNDYSNYTIGSSLGFSKPDTNGGDSNMRNIILNTGNSIPDDLTPTNLFVGFYNRITSLVQNYNPRFDPLLPLWIIYPMIFLILFRMLRH